MGEIIGSSHTGLQVRDIARSLRFYEGLLGLTVRQRRTVAAPSYIGRIVGYPDVEMHQAFLDIPGSDHWLELLEYRGIQRGDVDPATGNIGTVHLCLRVTGLTELYNRLTEAGARFVGPPVEPTEGPNMGGLVVYMIDPDGIRVELVETNSRRF